MRVFFLFLLIAGLIGCADITPYQRELLAFRKEKDFHFKNMPDSPIPDSVKPQFRGLSYFPIGEQWIFQATFIPQRDTSNSELAGSVEFEYRKKRYELTVFWEDTTRRNAFFLPFHDKTNGNTTYGGGRYLNIPYQGKSEVILDFNYAYHPFCVYNHEYVCKKPPKENTLDFEVSAGEKLQ